MMKNVHFAHSYVTCSGRRYVRLVYSCLVSRAIYPATYTIMFLSVLRQPLYKRTTLGAPLPQPLHLRHNSASSRSINILKTPSSFKPQTGSSPRFRNPPTSCPMLLQVFSNFDLSLCSILYPYVRRLIYLYWFDFPRQANLYIGRSMEGM